jgi:ABC-type transporter Mla MlaB component
VGAGDQQFERRANAAEGTRATTLVVVAGRIAPDTISRLDARFQELLAGSDCDLVICDVGALGDTDAATLDALARLQLAAKRAGREFRLHGASDELQALLTLSGLRAVLPLHHRSLIESRRQIEEGKEALGVEEGVEPDDPTA